MAHLVCQILLVVHIRWFYLTLHLQQQSIIILQHPITRTAVKMFAINRGARLHAARESIFLLIVAQRPLQKLDFLSLNFHSNYLAIRSHPVGLRVAAQIYTTIGLCSAGAI